MTGENKGSFSILKCLIPSSISSDYIIKQRSTKANKMFHHGIKLCLRVSTPKVLSITGDGLKVPTNFGGFSNYKIKVLSGMLYLFIDPLYDGSYIILAAMMAPNATPLGKSESRWLR